jgi:hypothetical protein
MMIEKVESIINQSIQRKVGTRQNKNDAAANMRLMPGKMMEAPH